MTQPHPHPPEPRISMPLRLALAQINPVVGDLEGNARKIIDAWNATPESADLIVFPELVLTGYPSEDLILKPAFIQSVEKHINALVKYSQNKKPAILLTAPWREENKTFNAALLIENGRIIATIKKHHLPNYGVFDEKRIFASADLQSPVPFRGINLGIMICEDMWFPDVAANLKTRGAHILVAPHGSPFAIQQKALRLKHAQSRVQETGLPLLYANQVGGQDELVFDGASFALNKNAELIHQSPAFIETIDYLDPLLWEAQGTTDTGALSTTVKPEEIYAAITLGLRDYVEKNKFPGVLIGLSGGIDSALAAIIAVDALGPARVRGIMMPSRHTSQNSIEDAQILADKLNIKLETIPIESARETFHTLLSSHLPENTPDDITFENIQSRIRAVLLMAISNATSYMLLSTGNKSELATGYATLYGDMCGGFNPLKDIYKTQIYTLSRWRNDHVPRGSRAPVSARIPQRTIVRAPTAELKDNQTDQDTLPPYEILDRILHMLIEEDLGTAEIIAAGQNADIVNKVATMLTRAEYKRYQAPPGPKISSRAFGRDRRYPLTNRFISD